MEKALENNIIEKGTFKKDDPKESEKKIQLNLNEYLNKYLKSSDAKIPRDHLSIEFIEPSDSTSSWLEIPGHVNNHQVVIALTTDSNEKIGLAAIGFKINSKQGIINVEQIQGVQSDRKTDVKKTIKILPQLHWEEMLVTILEDWAKLNDFKEVKILKSQYSEWRYKETESEWSKKHNERLKKHYDDTAEHMGYAIGTDKERYWLKTL